MRRLLTLTLAAAFALAAPAAARAATLTSAAGTVTFVAAAGKTNVIVFDETTPGTVHVSRDAGLGDNDPLATVTGCTPVTPQVEYVCTGIADVVADAGDGDDSLSAALLTNADALLLGGAGGDVLSGGASNDALDGGDDGDSLSGGDGNDLLTGDEGDDTLDGGAGADDLVGGPGIDTAVFDGAAAKAVSLDGVANDGAAGEGDNVSSGVEDVQAAAAAASTVTLIGDAAGNALTVTAGEAAISGGDGGDTLTGGPQDDVISARDGFADRVVCGAGTDVAIVDEFDTVSASCETVQVASVPGGADDRPPSVAWTAPAASAALTAGIPVALAATASDDRGVAKVQFLVGDRLLCDDASAPYTCAYSPRGDDVGRDTLVAIAVDGAQQTATATRAVTVGRFAARSLSLSLRPLRDRFAPFTFTASGKLTLPDAVGRGDGCAGSVTVTVRAAGRTVATRHPKLSHFCEYKAAVKFHSRPASRLTFLARFEGNDAVKAASAPSKHARTR
jgi:hypothetical protein